MDASEEILKTRQLGDKLKDLETELNGLEINLEKYRLIPNIPLGSVPDGSTEADNVEIKNGVKRLSLILNQKTIWSWVRV